MNLKPIVLLFAVATFALCGRHLQFDGRVSSDHTATSEPTKREKQRQWKNGHVYVTKVIDGDTFWVDNGIEEFKVRFIGIDAPETRNVGRKKKGYFAAEAKDYVSKLTLHKWVRLELDVQEKDPYQRLLAYVFLTDGTFLNGSLVAGGYAVVDTYPPNVKYVDLLTDLQQQAREEQLGIWSEPQH